MPVLLKIRTDAGHEHFLSMAGPGLTVGRTFDWGDVGQSADYRSAGDIKFLRDGGVAVNDLVLARERMSQSKTYFMGLMRVLDIQTFVDASGVPSYRPIYELLERFDGSATVDRIRAADPKVAALPHFQKNAKGFMLRSFTPLTKNELDVILKAVRRSMR